MAPGSCELEAYGNIGPAAAWRGVVSPTCAFKALGDFEVGIIAAAEGPANGIIPGISFKTGVGQRGIASLAAEISLGFDPEGNQLGYISTNLPVSFAPASWLEVHINGGLDFEVSNLFIPTYGVSALIRPLPDFQLVAELAGRGGFGSRSQFGIRYTAGAVILDALYSRNIDETRRGGWATFGLTWAFGIGGRSN